MAGHKNPVGKNAGPFAGQRSGHGIVGMGYGRVMSSLSLRGIIAAVAVAATLSPLPAPAQERGSVTSLPLPRFVSIRAAEANVRRGPSTTHRIDWVFTRRDMPVQITAEYGHWRRIEDREGAGGWVHYSLLSGVRTVIVDQDLLPLRNRPDPAAPEAARLELGVVARVQACIYDWCRLSAGGHRGWAPKSAIWGVSPTEVFD